MKNRQRDEKRKRVALFIGRFQPFHKGHLYMVKKILERYDQVIIGLGSAQYSNTRDNPFTSKERLDMMVRALTSEGINRERFTVIPLDDLHNDELWVSHVESIVSRFDAVFTHEPLTKQIFTRRGYKVIELPLLDREMFSGTEVRKRILNNGDWRSLVPRETAVYLDQLRVADRLRKVQHIS